MQRIVALNLLIEDAKHRVMQPMEQSILELIARTP